MPLLTIDARLRAICLALPEAHEEAMRRGPSYRVGDKIFAARAAVERMARALVQGPARGARNHHRRRAGAIFRSSLFRRQGLDRRRPRRSGRLARGRGVRPPQLSARRPEAAGEAGGLKRRRRGLRAPPRGHTLAAKGFYRGNAAMLQDVAASRPPPEIPVSPIDPFSLDLSARSSSRARGPARGRAGRLARKIRSLRRGAPCRGQADPQRSGDLLLQPRRGFERLCSARSRGGRQAWFSNAIRPNTIAPAPCSIGRCRRR